MLSPQAIQRVEGYWADYFGCPVSALRGSGSRVLVRGVQDSAWVFRYGDVHIWHVPESHVAAVNRALCGGMTATEAFQEEVIRRVCGASLLRIIGPCPIGYCDPTTFRGGTMPLHPCRLLGEADREALDRLAEACGEEEWERGGIEPALHPAIVGCFEGDCLVAAASYETWGDTLAHVCIVTAPDRRGRGLGRSVAAEVTAEAMRRGLVPQWRTLASNTPALAVARAVGYVPVASHFFVGLST